MVSLTAATAHVWYVDILVIHLPPHAPLSEHTSLDHPVTVAADAASASAITSSALTAAVAAAAGAAVYPNHRFEVVVSTDNRSTGSWSLRPKTLPPVQQPASQRELQARAG
jgi:hypothetical protein